MAVVLHHFRLKFPGGYVGVDVFFVISGYLITGILLRELDQGTFSFINFWERRARRILPAMGAMVLLAVIAGAFLLLPFDYEELGRSVLAQTFFAGNIYYFNTGGYFALPLSECFLMHTWSLAVEEQFYILFPFLIWGGALWARRLRRPGVLLTLVTGGLVCSLLYSVFLIHRDQIDQAFYMIPPRAWELLCGSFLAMLPCRAGFKSQILREVTCWSGLALIILPCFLYQTTTVFPGIAAVWPCLGTMLLLLGNQPHPEFKATVVSNLLAFRPLVGIGLISYSLYLWHWPIWLYVNYWFPHPIPPIPARIALIVPSFLIAWLSWKYVETPFRKRKLCATPRAMFCFAGTVLCTFFISGGLLIANQGFSKRFNREEATDMIQCDMARRQKGDRTRRTAEDILAGRVTFLGENRDQPPALLVWGDSHAMHTGRAAELLCKETGITGRLIADWGWNPFISPSDTLKRKDQAAAVMEAIDRHQFKYVLLAAKWRNTPDLRQKLQDTVDYLKKRGCKVWVLMNIPIYDIEIPKMLAREAFFRTRDDSWRRAIGSFDSQFQIMKEIARSGTVDATFIDPLPAFTEPGNPFYLLKKNGAVLYNDSNHMTTAGSEAVLFPLLKERMETTIRGR